MHWEGAQKPHCCARRLERWHEELAAWRARISACEGESAAGCFIARQAGTQQMSSCSPGLQRLSSELPLQMTHLPTKQSVLFARNGLINALMILHIFFPRFFFLFVCLFQSCYHIQMSAGPFEIFLNGKIKNQPVLEMESQVQTNPGWELQDFRIHKSLEPD